MKTFLKWAAWGAGIVIVVMGINALGTSFFPPKKAIAQVPAPIQSIPTVTIQDLTAAGFTDPKVQPPAGVRFEPPMYYFRVKESVSDHAWQQNGASNLVAVDIFPTPWEPVAVTGGNNVIKNLSDRVSVCNSKVGVYFCMIGPDQAKGEALINILKAK